MKKRFLGVILAIFVVLMLFPLITFANTTYTDWTDTTKLPTEEGAYKLTCDVTITSMVTVGAWSGKTTTVTLDLNGYRVNFNGTSAYYYVNNAGSLIIEDSVGTGLMTNAGATNNQYIIYVKGNCQINGGIIENTLQNGQALYINNGDNKQASCTLNEGVIKNSYDKSGRAVVVGNNATFIMNKGEIKNNAAGTNGTVPAIDGTQKTGKIIITGGTIESVGTGIKAANSKVEITGGTIEADWFALETRYATIEPAEDKTVNISAGKAILNPYSMPSTGDGNKIIGGNFEAPALTNNNANKNNIELYGGTYTNNNALMDLTDYLQDAIVDDKGTVTCSHTETYNEGAVDATCTLEGRSADIICSNCKKIVTEGTTIPLEEHTYGEWVIDKEATCTEKGSRYKECLCGDKETEEIEATGHSYENGKCTACEELDPNVENKKDETPKTGSVDLVVMGCAIIAILSVVGIVISKKYIR